MKSISFLLVKMRNKFQELPAVPVIFALRNALFLEPPSDSQKQFAKAAEEERSHMNEFEIKLLINNKNTSSETEDSAQADELLPNKFIEDLKKSVAKRKTDVKDTVQFKRKRAKGPNPLSCKKKKTEKQKPVAKNKDHETDDTEVQAEEQEEVS